MTNRIYGYKYNPELKVKDIAKLVKISKCQQGQETTTLLI